MRVFMFFGTFFQDGSKRPPGCPQTPFAPHLRSDFFLELYLLLPLHFYFSLQRQRKTLPADCMSSLSRGAAMTRRRRLQYIFAAPPKGEQGVLNKFCRICRIWSLEEPRPPPPAPAKLSQKWSEIDDFSDLEKNTKNTQKRRMKITKVTAMESLRGPWEPTLEPLE